MPRCNPYVADPQPSLKLAPPKPSEPVGHSQKCVSCAQWTTERAKEPWYEWGSCEKTNLPEAVQHVRCSLRCVCTLCSPDVFVSQERTGPESGGKQCDEALETVALPASCRQQRFAFTSR